MATVFITGAASGIGLATAKRLHAAGWQLGLTDANAEALAQVAAELGTWSQVLDVRDAVAVKAAVDDFVAAHGGQLNLCFNCAGVLRTGAFEKMPAENHALLLDVNVKGVINVLLGSFEALKATPGALVVNMSSASALYGTPDFATYSATKFAVRALTESLGLEWRKHDIQVVDLMPPFVKTPMADANYSPIMDRMGVELTAEDIAEALYALIHKKHRPVHNPVGLKFKATVLASKILPTEMTRVVMRYLSRGL